MVHCWLQVKCFSVDVGNLEQDFIFQLPPETMLSVFIFCATTMSHLQDGM